MKKDPEHRRLVRLAGDRRLESRVVSVEALRAELLASARDFDAVFAAAEEPGLFERAVRWLESLLLPEDVLVVAPVAVRGQVSLHQEQSGEAGETALSTETGSKVEIAFENHHDAPVWVVACEREPDGAVSFIPGKELAEAPRVEPGDSLTFRFVPDTATTVRVLAIALSTQPAGDPVEIFAEPSRLRAFGIVATARFVLRVNAPPT